MMQKITEITRRSIFDIFLNGIDLDWGFETEHICYKYYGRVKEVEFLGKLYNLKQLPSTDERFKNAEEDIQQHTVNYSDYQEGWVFEDKRFELLSGQDQTFLEFLCMVFQPTVRDEKKQWREFLNRINQLLRVDGYELYSTKEILEVYEWRESGSDFFPFSQLHETEIQARSLSFVLKYKVRKQISILFNKYNASVKQVDKNGEEYWMTLSDCIFSKLSKFYTPKCYDEQDNYVETDSIEKFILKSSPFCVFDAIELCEKYNDGRFAEEINSIFKHNNVTYEIKHGRIISTLNGSINTNEVIGLEKGVKDLIIEAEKHYHDGEKNIAVEKIWDAFERMKTYYLPELDKRKSAEKIVDDMSQGNDDYKEMFDNEFLALTKIGNNFRIRHHERNKIDITDNRQYEYFYKRCFALVSVAIQYLER